MPSIFDKIDDAGYFNAEAVSQRIEVALPKNEEKLDIDAIRKHIKSGTAEPINYSELEEDGWAIRSEARQGQSEGEAKYDLVRSSWNPNAYERYHERKRKLADRPQHIEAMKMQNIIKAERDGVVKAVGAKAGDSVAADEVLVEFA